MTKSVNTKGRLALLVAGAFLLPTIWVFAKYVLCVSDRFLPTPLSVFQAVEQIEPAVWIHLAYTGLRLLIGYILGVAVGVLLALLMLRSSLWNAFLIPTLQSLRAVPAAATVPFFLLWFGFSEWGRYLLVVSAIAFNIAIAGYEILRYTPDSHAGFFHSFNIKPGFLVWRYALPRIIENLLPTLRFSLVVAIGAVTVSELLGSQVGMGYLIQTSRSTFSLNALFLAVILLGLLSFAADFLLVLCWKGLLFWRKVL
jgi:NitT/TauT family transport system permease protein